MLERLYLNIPIQLCQFHQIKTVLIYTTKSPKTECGKELKSLILTLSNKEITEDGFTKQFINLKTKYEEFLKEKSINKEKNKIEYTHKRLRSAFRSIKTNLPYLFTYKKEEYKHLKIPNTTNGCDGKFGRVKIKLSIHSGLKLKRKSEIFDVLMNN